MNGAETRRQTLSSLTGILVMAAVLWLWLNFVYAPSCGRFACSLEPAWWPQAEADSGETCPDSISTAANDAAWAADRIESIKDAKLTTGLYYDRDGTNTGSPGPCSPPSGRVPSVRRRTTTARYAAARSG
ncbi:MAG: hypothetical protein WBA97_20770 [Actinophytocola sp.]|uniref:hypothetical protein n=1 Tax=Actinophytocola sp. TaxID=1872138 RepID=UPI003C76D755